MTAVAHGVKVVLCVPSQEDFEKIAKWEADVVLGSLVGKEPGRELIYTEWYSRLLKGRNCRLFTIRTRDDELIGDIALAEMNWRTGEAELALVRIGEASYRERGYGRDAILTLLNFVFTSLGLERIYLRVFRDNLPAIRCYEGCGFKREGILRVRGGRIGLEKDILLMTAKREDVERRATPQGASGF